jgi:signal transduction histidine kinase
MTLNQFFPLGEDEKFRAYLYSEDYGGRNRLVFLEVLLLNSSGGKIPVQLSATVLFDDGEERGIVGIFRDLREIRRLEQQFADQTRLLQQDKMISLGRLAASIVHEINNPLAGMLNYIRLMIKILNRGSLEQEHLEKFKRYLSLIDGETDRCSKIVSNLLAFSRKSRLEFNGMDVNDLLQKCIMLSQHRLSLQNIHIKTDLGKKIPPVVGDFNQIQQCIINLIFNAIDSMPEGGSMDIESSYDAKGKVAKIIVRDTGCGISKDEILNIFDPFYTTKKEGKGIGLGLSTAYGIIDRHKGTISVDTELGKGTVFTIKLPVDDKSMTTRNGIQVK